MTSWESHWQCQSDEVFIGHRVTDDLEPIARRYKTLRLGNSEEVAPGDWRLPLFIKRSEAEQQKLLIDRHGNVTPMPEL